MALVYFKALSDETRLRLVHILLHYELSVNELVRILGMGQSRVSRHLKILTEAGLLTSRRDGLWVFYAATRCGEASDFLQAMGPFLHTDTAMREDLAMAAQILEERALKTRQVFKAIAEDWDELNREVLEDFDLPAAVLAISLMIGSYIISVKRNYPKGQPFSLKVFIKQLLTSFWALAAILIVVVGVVGGMFTATESAAIAVLYSLFVSVFVYKGLNWKGVWKALDNCVSTLSIVLILIATSSLFGDCLTKLHVPDLAANAITSISSNPIIIALLLNLILLVLGCIMDMAPIILIATPILLPIAKSIGIDPIQFGIIVVLNCGIGLLTPPVGAVLFIGSAVGKTPMEKVVKATLPFYICMIITLLLITFVPDISLLLPKLLGGYVPIGG